MSSKGSVPVTKTYHAVRVTTGQTAEFAKEQLVEAKLWVMCRLTGHVDCREVDPDGEVRQMTVFRVRNGEVL